MTTRTLSIYYKAEVPSAFNPEEFAVAFVALLQRHIQPAAGTAAVNGSIQVEATMSRVFSLNANGYVDTDGGDRLVPNSCGTFTRIKNVQ